MSQAEGWRREQRYLKRNRIWIFNLNERWVRDAAVGGNIARYVNHACRPNCYTDVVGRTIWIIAARPISDREELTYDYNTDGVAGIRACAAPAADACCRDRHRASCLRNATVAPLGAAAVLDHAGAQR